MTRSGAALARPGIRALLLAAWLLLPAPGASRAQAADAPPPAPEEAQVAELEAEIARLEALAAQWIQRTAEMAQAREGGPRALEEIRAEIADLGARSPAAAAMDLAPEDVEAALIGAEQDLALARKQAMALEAEADKRGERRKRLPELLATAKERLLALGSEPPPPTAAGALADARRRLAAARRRVTENEVLAYEEELRSYDALGQLLAARRELAAARVLFLEQEVPALEAALGLRRRDEAQVAAEEAERLLESAEAMPSAIQDLVRRLAAENRELALERTGDEGLVRRIDETSRKLARSDARVAAVQAALERLRRKVELAGLSNSVGLLLRRTRAAAPDVGMYRRFIRQRQDHISEVQIRQIELAERRESLARVDAVVAEALATFEALLLPEDRRAAESALRELLEAQKRTLEALSADTDTYFQELVDFDASQRKLVAQTEALLRFIDERVLWIPSGALPSGEMLSGAGEALAWLADPVFWRQVGRAFRDALLRAPLLWLVAALLVVAGPIARPRLRLRLAEQGELARQPGCIRIEPTAASLGLSLLLAVWYPALLAFLGWRLGVSPQATQFVRCIAEGLWVGAAVWVSLSLPRQLLVPGGLAEAHLGWPEAPGRRLRRQLGWLTWVVVPAVALIAILEARGEDAWRESLGRLAFVGAMGAVTVFAGRILREKGALRQIVAAQAELAAPGWVLRALYAAGVGVSAALLVGAVLGYTWTAFAFAIPFHLSFVLLFLLLVADRLAARWAAVARRRLALQRWQEARSAAPIERSPGADAPDVGQPALDLATVDAHTARLLRTGTLFAMAIGLWLIWADLLPAAGVLRSVELWTTTASVGVEMTDADGETFSSVEQRAVPITLADLALALLVAAATLVLVRNLPGFLELSLFRVLKANPGERYAYTTIGEYALILLGVALALNAVGVRWTNIQWLVAALGIGLGFGLQEIFANFVSGLIILFERPIRVGDTVTVGDISGTVSRIQIRSTWITAFDRKELVVPNKEFITSRLVNWSLSDAVLRVEIRVGIAYGSDTEKACRVLMEVAERNAQVLRDPRPVALFRGFGESSLDFELRVFSPDAAHYLQISHDLHMEIDRAFRAEGIEIAFPQRDLHVRSLPVPRSQPGPLQGPQA
jgi:potassium efflux system protein